MLSIPSADIPAKKHHAASERFLRSRLEHARSKLRNPAAKGRKKRAVTV
jgi:hypothetical protein